MRKMIVLLLLLGITIYFNAESGQGFVFVNATKINTTIIIRPLADSALMYGDDGYVGIMTYKRFLEVAGDLPLKCAQEAQSAIVPIPPPKEAPKIFY
jgi:hypothetical protein